MIVGLGQMQISRYHGRPHLIGYPAKEDSMKSPEENGDKTAEELAKVEITARQYRENLKMQEALKKQEQWRDLLEE